MGGGLNGDKRDFDTLRLDRGGLSGAGNIQKPRAEADGLCAVARGAGEAVLAGDVGFAAGASGGGSDCAGSARGGPRADCSGAAARAGCDADACAAAGFPGAGGCGAGGKSADGDADLSDRLGRRQRAARALAAGYVAGVYGSAAQEPEIPRKARKNEHLHRGLHQIALPCRAGSGGLSDGGCAANE